MNILRLNGLSAAIASAHLLLCALVRFLVRCDSCDVCSRLIDVELHLLVRERSDPLRPRSGWLGVHLSVRFGPKTFVGHIGNPLAAFDMIGFVSTSAEVTIGVERDNALEAPFAVPACSNALARRTGWFWLGFFLNDQTRDLASLGFLVALDHIRPHVLSASFAFDILLIAITAGLLRWLLGFPRRVCSCSAASLAFLILWHNIL